ncbi:uncharacterized protein LOC132675739 isoform X2 [Panthera onca]
MKQLANQTVGRAEKTEVLSEDLLQLEAVCCTLPSRRRLMLFPTHSTGAVLSRMCSGEKRQGAMEEFRLLCEMAAQVLDFFSVTSQRPTWNPSCLFRSPLPPGHTVASAGFRSRSVRTGRSSMFTWEGKEEAGRCQKGFSNTQNQTTVFCF